MRRRTRRRVLAASSLVVAAGVVTVVVVVTSGGDTPAAGETISAADLAYYRTLAAGGAVPGGTGEDALREQILEDRAVLHLAHQHGVATGVATVDDLLATRGTASASPTYGAGTYGVVAFYGRTLTQLRTATFDAMTEGDHPALQVDDAQVRAEVQAHPATWSAGATTYTTTRLVVPWTVGGTSGQDVLAANAAACNDPTQAATTIPGATVGAVTLHGSDLTASGLSPDAQSSLTGLAVGACLAPQTDDQHWVLYRLDARTVDQAAAVTLYGPQIRQQLLQRRFDALVSTTASHLRDGSTPKGTS